MESKEKQVKSNHEQADEESSFAKETRKKDTRMKENAELQDENQQRHEENTAARGQDMEVRRRQQEDESQETSMIAEVSQAANSSINSDRTPAQSQGSRTFDVPSSGPKRRCSQPEEPFVTGTRLPESDLSSTDGIQEFLKEQVQSVRKAIQGKFEELKKEMNASFEELSNPTADKKMLEDQIAELKTTLEKLNKFCIESKSSTNRLEKRMQKYENQRESKNKNRWGIILVAAVAVVSCAALTHYWDFNVLNLAFDAGEKYVLRTFIKILGFEYEKVVEPSVDRNFYSPN